MSVTVTYDFNGANDGLDINFGTTVGGAAVATLANGGFAVLANSPAGVVVTAFDGLAHRLVASTPFAGATNGALDQLSNGNLIVAGQDGDSIRYTIVNPVTGAQVAPVVDLGSMINGTNAEVTALANGGAIIAFQANFGGDDNDIIYQLVSNTGVAGAQLVVDNSLVNDANADITQLDGGNVVIAWTRTIGAETEIWYLIVSPTGQPVSGPTLADTQGTVNRDVSVTALNGGGFALAYLDNEYATGLDNISLATFNATGAPVNKFNITSTNISEAVPDVTRLPNGMLIVATERGLAFDALIDPTTGARLAERDVISVIPGNDPRNPTSAAVGPGLVATVYTDQTGNFSGGQVHILVRHSTVDEFTFASATVTGDGLVDQIVGGDFSSSGDTLSGGGGNDVIDGLAGSDEINGDDGDDLLIGGSGSDVISGGDGSDQIFAFTQADPDGGNGFDLLSGGEGNDTIVGSGGSETLNGDGGNDTLIGGLSSDTMDGGVGSDTADYSARTGPIVAVLAGAAPVSVSVDGGSEDTISNIENIIGSSAADTLTGDGFANRFFGGGGVDALTGAGGLDTLDGGADADILRGGADGDTYVIDNANDVVDESVAGSSGLDVVKSSAISIDFTNTSQYVGAVERIVLEGSLALNATGNAIDNLITGNSGANLIDGRAGGDVMRGVGGSDTYVVDNANDIVDESLAGSTGLDVVKSSLISVDLSNTTMFRGAIERIVLEGSLALNATGNALDNLMTGNSGANSLDGKAGGDVMRGVGGSDIYVVDNTNDIVDEKLAGSNGIDTVKASTISIDLQNAAQYVGAIERITLEGGSGFNASGNALGNLITGNSGANRIHGREGADVARGLGGNDTFVFRSAADSGLGANRDIINDFEDVGDNDTVDLSGFAGVFAYIAQATFTAANQVRATQFGNHVLVEINTVGVNGAESEILLANTMIGQIDTADFIV